MLHPLPAPPAYDAGPYNHTLAMEINGQEPLALRSFEGPHADCRPFSMLQLPKMDLILTENRGWGVKAAAPIPRGAFIVEYAGAISFFAFSFLGHYGQDWQLLP